MKVLLALCLLLLTAFDQKPPATCKNGPYILQQSIHQHDPNGVWLHTEFDMVVEEPRKQVPTRASLVKLNVANGAFEMQRARDGRTTTHLVDETGKAATLLDGQVETDTALIKKYFMQPERNANYRNYYRFMYGLPMVLDQPGINMGKVGSSEFEGQTVIHIDFTMEQPMIAKTWRVFFDKNDYHVLGIQTMDNAEEGEYLVFNGSAEIEGLKLPRFRHWYDSQTNEYLGSDLLIRSQK